MYKILYKDFCYILNRIYKVYNILSYFQKNYTIYYHLNTGEYLEDIYSFFKLYKIEYVIKQVILSSCNIINLQMVPLKFLRIISTYSGFILLFLDCAYFLCQNIFMLHVHANNKVIM